VEWGRNVTWLSKRVCGLSRARVKARGGAVRRIRVSLPTTDYIDAAFTRHLERHEELRCYISVVALLAHSGVTSWLHGLRLGKYFCLQTTSDGSCWGCERRLTNNLQLGASCGAWALLRNSRASGCQYSSSNRNCSNVRLVLCSGCRSTCRNFLFG
jgi:hypothetical protein